MSGEGRRSIIRCRAERARIAPVNDPRPRHSPTLHAPSPIALRLARERGGGCMLYKYSMYVSPCSTGQYTALTHTLSLSVCVCVYMYSTDESSYGAREDAHDRPKPPPSLCTPSVASLCCCPLVVVVAADLPYPYIHTT